MHNEQSYQTKKSFSADSEFWQVSIEVAKEDALIFQDFFLKSGSVGFFELLYQEGITNNLQENNTRLFFFFEKSFPAQAFSVLACSFLDVPDIEPTCTLVKYKDYLQEFKKTFRAFALSEKTWLLPPWHKPSIPEGCRSFVLKPGMAFGTGKHVTSVLMTSYIEENLQKDDKIFDLGCGSGILSLASLTWGAQKAIGVDVEKLSVEAACENAALNKDFVDKSVFRQGDFSFYREKEFFDELKKTDVFLANILASVFYAHPQELKNYLEINKRWALSGITVEQKDEFTNFLHKLGQENFLLQEREGWLLFFSAS